MHRSKPYTGKKLALDITLTLFTAGMYLMFVFPFWELYRFAGPHTKCAKCHN